MEKNGSWVDYFETCSLIINSSAFRFRKYIARICGDDDIYGLKRMFLRFSERSVSWGAIIYDYGKLPDGVYEASVKFYETTDDDSLLLCDRNIVILYDDDFRVFPYSEMSKTTILSIVEAIRYRTYVLPPD